MGHMHAQRTPHVQSVNQHNPPHLMYSTRSIKGPCVYTATVCCTHNTSPKG
jgi:hypothetical protein